MKKLNKTVIRLSCIAEVFLWIGTAVMLGLFIASLIVPDKLGFMLESGSLTISGFNIATVDAAGNAIPRAVTVCTFAGILIMPLSAMIARNIHLIFQTAAGATAFSQGVTPFQKDNVRMVREIGIFSIAIPAVELLVSVIAQLYVGNVQAEYSVNLNGVFFGLVILCLSQFFAYGVSLQEEVDGLV